MGLSDNCVLLCILIPAMQCGKYTDLTRLRGDLDAFLANNSGLQLLLGNFLTEPSPRKQVFRSNHHFCKLLMLKSAVAEILKEHDAIAHKYMPSFTSQHYLKRDETSLHGINVRQRFVNVLKTNFGEFGNTAHFDGHQRKKYQRNFSYNTSVQKIDWQPTANHLFQKLALSVIFTILSKHNATAPSSTTVPSWNPIPRPDLFSRLIKRVDPVKAHIELMVVVDRSIYMRYLSNSGYSAEIAKSKLYQYLSILIELVNQRFENIRDTGFSIRVHVCDILTAKTRREIAWFEGITRWSKTSENHVVSATRALKRFQRWLKRSRKILPKYDHAVFMSSYILSKKRRKAEGYAYIGTMCEVAFGKSASIVQDEGDFVSAGVIAHELAHSLGVDHDGVGNSYACPAANNNVMAPQTSDNPAVSSNIYHFSLCSVMQLRTFVQSPRASCLLNSPRKLLTYNMKRDPPGKVFDVNEQCQLAISETSQFCDTGSRLETVCERLWCTSPGNMCLTSNRLVALPGTTCGTGKHCEMGKCVALRRTFVSTFQSVRVDASTFHRNSDCPFEPTRCRFIVKASPKLCAMERYQKYCCKSCSKSLIQD